MNREDHPSLRQRLLDDETIRGRIAVRAYQIFEERGRLHGYDIQDWQQAEAEILSEWIAREERNSLADAGYPEAETGVAGTRPKQRRTRTREKPAVLSKTDTASRRGGKETARAKTRVKAAPAQKANSPDMKSIAEPEQRPLKKGSTGPKNRKKEAAPKASPPIL